MYGYGCVDVASQSLITYHLQHLLVLTLIAPVLKLQITPTLKPRSKFFGINFNYPVLLEKINTEKFSKWL